MSDETKAANQLILQPNIHDADGFYDELLQVHEGLSKDQSDALKLLHKLLHKPSITPTPTPKPKPKPTQSPTSTSESARRVV